MSDNIELVKSFFATFFAGDAEGAVTKHMAEEVVVENKLPQQIPFSGVYKGHAGVFDYLGLLDQLIEITRFDFHHYAAVGDRVFVSGIEGSNVKANGKSYLMEWVHEFQIRDGKIVLQREYNNCAEMLTAFA